MNGWRWLPHPLLSILLTVLWLLLNNTLSFAHVLLGAFLGWGIALLCRPLLMPVPRVAKPLALLRFALRVGSDIVIANLSVAKLVMGPRAKLRPAFIEIPMQLDDDFTLSLLTSIISLTPGTVSASLSSDRRKLLVHALDAPDPQQLVAEIQRRYEAPLLEIFQCSRP